VVAFAPLLLPREKSRLREERLSSSRNERRERGEDDGGRRERGELSPPAAWRRLRGETERVEMVSPAVCLDCGERERFLEEDRSSNSRCRWLCGEREERRREEEDHEVSVLVLVLGWPEESGSTERDDATSEDEEDEIGLRKGEL